jgi:hypothetical protein
MLHALWLGELTIRHRQDYARGQGVPWALAPEIPPRDVAQLFVDQRNQRFKGLWIARFPAYQQFANWVESD